MLCKALDERITEEVQMHRDAYGANNSGKKLIIQCQQRNNSSDREEPSYRSYRLKTAQWQRPTERSMHLLHFNPADDCSSWELSLLDKAGSQVDKGIASRHEPQLGLSTSIAFCWENKLTSCHNISKWISGDLDSKCITLICPCCAECASGPNNVMWTQMELVENKKEQQQQQQKRMYRPVSLSFSPKTFVTIQYEYNISITQKQPVNASTGMSYGKMGLGMRSDFSLHSSSKAPYLCLMWAVYRKRDFNG